VAYSPRICTGVVVVVVVVVVVFVVVVVVVGRSFGESWVRLGGLERQC
jgi:hypothetical protein